MTRPPEAAANEIQRLREQVKRLQEVILAKRELEMDMNVGNLHRLNQAECAIDTHHDLDERTL